jgi:hypothetical protein
LGGGPTIMVASVPIDLLWDEQHRRRTVEFFSCDG